MAEFVKVGTLGDFPAGAIRRCQVGEERLAIANVAGRMYAFSDYCTHVGLDLSSGYLAGSEVVCMYHGSAFNPATGEAVGGPAQAPLTIFPVRVEGDDVFVGRA